MFLVKLLLQRGGGRMFFNIFLACTVMVGTTVIHALGMMLVFWFFSLPLRHRAIPRILQISSIVLLMFIVSVVEVMLWAIVYLWLNTIETFERALYFSMVTYTTLGYGDIVLEQKYHLLSSFEAANGIIMFGWTTSIVIASVQKLYLPTK